MQGGHEQFSRIARATRASSHCSMPVTAALYSSLLVLPALCGYALFVSRRSS